jgi:ubiquinone/menaquinone biosynthesis C-methylase UbiE
MEHRHHGKSSADFLDSDEILTELNFKGNETFMDAGCGDGHIAIKALKDYLPDGTAHAVDNHKESIDEIESYIKENDLENLIAVHADFTKGVSAVRDESIDVILMLNVFHGFKASGEMDVVIEELKRMIKDEGKIAIMDFKAIDMAKGPSTDIKSTPDELEELFSNHNLKMIYLNEEIGEDIPEGKSHFIIIFEKD